jgi:voltage-gated potassium channel Kch
MDRTDDRLVLVLGDNMQTATLRLTGAASAIAAVIATTARFLL